MVNNLIKKRLYDGEVCLGTWIFIPSPEIVEIVGLSGFDFIVIDMEHSPISHNRSIELLRAAELHGLNSIIRVPTLNSSSILRALDSGAHGIQVPHIKNKLSASTAVKYSKYFPQGIRGMAPNARAGLYSYDHSVDTPSNQNNSTLVSLNVEGIEGVKNLSEISKVENVDVIFIGPYDLSQSLGFPGETERPEVLNLIEKSIKVIRSSGKIAGCFCRDYKKLNTLVDMGVQYITFSADGPIIRNAFQDIKSNFNL